MPRTLEQKLEKDIERLCVKYARDHKCMLKKLALVDEAGFPDRTLFTDDGRTVFVELKRGKQGRLGSQQDHWISLLTRKGFEVWVILSYQEFKFRLDNYL